VKRKQYLYHVTEKDWVREVTLTPKEDGCNRDDREPKIARICTAPTIEGCLIAIHIPLMDHLNVYRTKGKVYSRKPVGVCDSHITGERWVTHSTNFIFVNRIDRVKSRFEKSYNNQLNNGVNIGDGTEASEKWQMKMKDKIKKFLTSST
jgi:hypothetical protein